jgi:hypothetical protein
MYTVIVTGSRDYTDDKKVFEALESLWATTEGPFFVMHGACPTGADKFASVWFDFQNEDTYEIPVPAIWDVCMVDCPPGHRKMKKTGDTAHPGLLPDYCPKAGPRRNRMMAQRGADLCLAFPLGESRGTWNCVNECKKAGIPVKVVT